MFWFFFKFESGLIENYVIFYLNGMVFKIVLIKRIYFFMLNKILFCSVFLFFVIVLVERLDYFNDEIDKEYCVVLKYMDEMML